MQRQTSSLRLALLADAVAGGAAGLLMTLGAGPLSALLALPEPLLRMAGIVLLPFAILVGMAGARDAVSRSLVMTIVIANALWVVDSFALLASGWVAPNGLGVAFVVAQAVAVGTLAAAQAFGLRSAGQFSAAAV